MIEEFKQLIDATGLQEHLYDKPRELQERGLSLYIEMINDIVRCITDLEGGTVVEYDEIREFLTSHGERQLICTNAECEIKVRKVPGKKALKLVSVMFFTHYSVKSFTVH